MLLGVPMIVDRREFLALSSALVAVLSAPPAFPAVLPKRLVFIHGRGQEGLDATKLKQDWISVLKTGATNAGLALPDSVEIAFPFYGDRLAKFVADFGVPTASNIHSKGGPVQDEYLLFQANVAEDLRQRAGVTDAEINKEFGGSPSEKSPLNWEWVLAILRALDKHADGLSQATLELFTRDVFLYVSRPVVRAEIDKIVRASLTTEPTVIVAYSLGTVVAYSLLRTDTTGLNVPLLVTVGSPLGIRSIRERFIPLESPSPVGSWFNAFDPHDVVALYPLDEANFNISPAIKNYGRVKNHTDDKHGIAGYLDDKTVARRIISGLSS
jgi:hypothetical protein